VGATTSQVALAWSLQKKALTSVIFGARTVEQPEENLARIPHRCCAQRVGREGHALRTVCSAALA
jgi:aryl-alcohol dehydrogenase-like predicted oxidoreductase